MMVDQRMKMALLGEGAWVLMAIMCELSQGDGVIWTRK